MASAGSQFRVGPASPGWAGLIPIPSTPSFQTWFWLKAFADLLNIVLGERLF